MGCLGGTRGCPSEPMGRLGGTRGCLSASRVVPERQNSGFPLVKHRFVKKQRLQIDSEIYQKSMKIRARQNDVKREEN